MLTVVLNVKDQITIPAEIRHALGLKAGDHFVFQLKGKKIVLTKIEGFNNSWHKALTTTLSEWASPEDDEDYRNL